MNTNCVYDSLVEDEHNVWPKLSNFLF